MTEVQYTGTTCRSPYTHVACYIYVVICSVRLQFLIRSYNTVGLCMKDTSISNEGVVCSTNYIELCTNLPVN